MDRGGDGGEPMRTATLYLAASVLALGPAIGVAPGIARAEATRTIAGTIVESGSSAGVTGATVSVKDAAPPVTATAASDGSFRLAGAPVGPVVLVVSAAGFDAVE